MKLLSTPTELSLRNVLVATDFSPVSQSALAHVLPIAQEFHSTIHLVHVIQPQAPDLTSGAIDARMLEQLRENAQAQILSIAAMVDGNRCRAWVRDGQVREVIADLVREKHIDLVVVGTSGKSTVDKLLRGSVAEEIFRNCVCPVLTLGPQVKYNPSGSTLKQILYLTNLKGESHGALDYAISLASHYEAQLMLLHVVEQEEPRKPEYQWLEVYRRMLRHLLTEVADLPIDPVLRIEVGRNPSARILWVAEEVNADLIVMDVRPEEPWATHLRDRAYEIISFAHCPVLTVRTRTVCEDQGPQDDDSPRRDHPCITA
jgi:nucleotide-binding universal stress UspA family protein